MDRLVCESVEALLRAALLCKEHDETAATCFWWNHWLLSSFNNLGSILSLKSKVGPLLPRVFDVFLWSRQKSNPLCYLYSSYTRFQKADLLLYVPCSRRRDGNLKPQQKPTSRGDIFTVGTYSDISSPFSFFCAFAYKRPNSLVTKVFGVPFHLTNERELTIFHHKWLFKVLLAIVSSSSKEMKMFAFLETIRFIKKSSIIFPINKINAWNKRCREVFIASI